MPYFAHPTKQQKRETDSKPCLIKREPACPILGFKEFFFTGAAVPQNPPH